MTKLLLLMLLIMTSVLSMNTKLENDISLIRYNIQDVTVSGISSGGYMAVQLHVAYSSLIKGAAIFAGGPFYCADSSTLIAETLCMAGKPKGKYL